MCWGGCMYMSVCMGACSICGDQSLTSYVLLCHSTSWLLRQGPSLDTKLTISVKTGWLASPQDLPVSTHWHWCYRHTLPHAGLSFPIASDSSSLYPSAHDLSSFPASASYLCQEQSILTVFVSVLYHSSRRD